MSVATESGEKIQGSKARCRDTREEAGVVRERDPWVAWLRVIAVEEPRSGHI